MRENSLATIALEAPDGPQGWRIVRASRAVTAVTFGSAYACSAVFPALSAEFGASRGEVALVGPTVTGFVFDQTGSYLAPILVSAAASVVAGFLTLRLRTDAKA